MASGVNALICCGLCVVLYTCMGLPVAARMASRPLALMLAPTLGWAVHSAITLPLFSAIGMSRTTVTIGFALPMAVAVVMLRKLSATPQSHDRILTGLSVGALIGAALLALVVMAAVLPRVSAEGVALAAPIFDHAKVAMIDEMVRLGVPSGNPFFGEVGAPAHLSYYYLWHFSAAQLALLAGLSGWEADAGLSWFTAFASLAAMAGFATWFSGHASSGVWVLILAATGSIRPVLYQLIGQENSDAIVGWQTGLGGWLFQVSWAPQHVASAMCVLLALYLVAELIQRPRLLTLVALALTITASFESSTWVGGIVLPLAAAPVTLLLLARSGPQARLRAFLFAGSAALLTLLLISPFVYDQFRTAALRMDGAPVAIRLYQVLSDELLARFGNIVNVPAFWLAFLPTEFPAFYFTGVVALGCFLRNRAAVADRKCALPAFTVLLVVSLGVAWLLVSTLGYNNDLGWRGVLPAVMVLMVFAATGLSLATQARRWPALAVAVVLVLLGLPDGLDLMRRNLVAGTDEPVQAFAAAPALWQAVRLQAAADERVANNPNFLDRMTPWGVNISWALLSDRRSCYASYTLAEPFAALSRTRRQQVDAQFARVFAGDADVEDIRQLAVQYDCRVAVVTPQDGAWNRDPFATSPLYRLAEANARWRIYKTVKLSPIER